MILCDDCLHADICENVTQGNCDWYMSEKEIRPTGEWINNLNGTFECSRCGIKHSKANYCPNCGADMRGSI